MTKTQKIYQKYIRKSISMIVIVSFAGSMLLAQTAKADFNSTTASQAFQIITESFNQDQTNISTSTIQTVQTPEEPSLRDWVLNRITEAGLDPKEADIIITCESRWNPDAMGINANHTADLGLWQINSIHKDISNADKLDYKKATEWVINKRLNDGHWFAWSCARKLARR